MQLKKKNIIQRATDAKCINLLTVGDHFRAAEDCSYNEPNTDRKFYC